MCNNGDDMKKLPVRKSTRLKNYNYSTSGAYFITICTKDRKNILSDIIVGEGLRTLPINKLTIVGNVVEQSIKYSNENYRGIKMGTGCVLY